MKTMTEADEAAQHFKLENENSLGLHSTFVLGKVIAADRLGTMPPTWSLIVARGPRKGSLEGVGFKSITEAHDWAEEHGHTIIGREGK